MQFDGNAGPPVGATLDESGVFSWQLDPAFFAAYELRFLDREGTEIGRVRVQVKRPAVAAADTRPEPNGTQSQAGSIR